MSIDSHQTESNRDSMTLPKESEVVATAQMIVSNQPTSIAVSQLPRLAYTIRETAEILGVSEKSVRRLITRRLLRPSRALRHLLIPKKEIERFLDDTTSK